VISSWLQEGGERTSVPPAPQEPTPQQASLPVPPDPSNSDRNLGTRKSKERGPEKLYTQQEQRKPTSTVNPAQDQRKDKPPPQVESKGLGASHLEAASFKKQLDTDTAQTKPPEPQGSEKPPKPPAPRPSRDRKAPTRLTEHRANCPAQGGSACGGDCWIKEPAPPPEDCIGSEDLPTDSETESEREESPMVKKQNSQLISRLFLGEETMVGVSNCT
jgi:hypothetical protein